MWWYILQIIQSYPDAQPKKITCNRPVYFKSLTSNAKCSPKEYFDDHVYQYESC